MKAVAVVVVQDNDGIFIAIVAYTIVEGQANPSGLNSVSGARAKLLMLKY